MHLSISKICEYGECTIQSRNFIEGEKLLNSNHILKCGKITSSNEFIQIKAFCLQTSNLRGKPHTINLQIKCDRSIVTSVCTCKAGLSGKCKHTLAVLLYCNRFDVHGMDQLSCTDIQCAWKEPQKKTVAANYSGSMLQDHECYKDTYQSCEDNFTPEQINNINNLLLGSGDNAFTKHIFGRHECIETQNSGSSISDASVIFTIVNTENSKTMEIIYEEPVNMLKSCCMNIYNKLCQDDILLACVLSRSSFQVWSQIRKLRITGSRVYEIYTYNANKNPDWKNKSFKYFYAKTFRSKFVEHGKKMKILQERPMKILL